MKNKRMKLPRLGTVLFFLTLASVPLLPWIPSHSVESAWGQDDLRTRPPAYGAAPALPKPPDLKSPPVTVYSMLENHSLVTWDTLAHFPYDTPDIEEEITPELRAKKKKYPIPGFIKKLNGVSVAVIGFMIPLDTNEAGDKATSFILARSQATCCYGITPRMNEWIFVQMDKGKTGEVMMDIPVTVFGTLSVGEEKKKDMSWTLYRMVSDKVSISKMNW